MSKRDQLHILIQAALALTVISLCWAFRDHFAKLLELPGATVADRLAFSVKWALGPTLMLFIGIIGAAGQRFFSSAIDGRRSEISHSLDINLRYNQNTVEQLLIGMMVWVNLALALPHNQLYFIPIMTCFFVIGRLAFWVGYAIRPIARDLGMLLTMLPTLCGFVWLVFWTISS
jgi:uncharacterized membrane protein YecN with MAPEG domain